MKPPINSQDTVRTTGSLLTASNLQHAMSLTKVDKAQLIKSYLQSQRVYRSFFKAEGEQDCAKWERQIDESHGDTILDKVQEAVFTTPVLKPRVPEQAVTRLEARETVRLQQRTMANSSIHHVGVRKLLKEPEQLTEECPTQKPRVPPPRGTLDGFLSSAKNHKRGRDPAESIDTERHAGMYVNVLPMLPS